MNKAKNKRGKGKPVGRRGNRNKRKNAKALNRGTDKNRIAPEMAGGLESGISRSIYDDFGPPLAVPDYSDDEGGMMGPAVMYDNGDGTWSSWNDLHSANGTQPSLPTEDASNPNNPGFSFGIMFWVVALIIAGLMYWLSGFGLLMSLVAGFVGAFLILSVL